MEACFTVKGLEYVEVAKLKQVEALDSAAAAADNGWLSRFRLFSGKCRGMLIITVFVLQNLCPGADVEGPSGRAMPRQL